MKHKFDLKKAFQSIGSHVWIFIKRLYVFIFCFGIFAMISYGVALLVPVILRDYINLDSKICLIIAKVLLTIAPLFPTIIYTHIRDEENSDEFSMDLCFIAWIATVVWAWVFL